VLPAEEIDSYDSDYIALLSLYTIAHNAFRMCVLLAGKVDALRCLGRSPASSSYKNDYNGRSILNLDRRRTFETRLLIL